jgi:hypothetical protein
MEKNLVTTDIALGIKASKDYMLQAFDGDERLPDLIAELFDERAAKNGSTAKLRTYDSSALIDLEELKRNAEGYEYAHEAESDFHDLLQTWLEEAYEEAGERWVNDEV